MKVKMAVIGASSMVGSRFCEMKTSDFELVKSDLTSAHIVDITDKKSVSEFFKNNDFTWAILFSAFTDVDQAEKQRNDKNGSCWQINVQGTKNVCQACQKYGRKLIFISTDFVFDGSKGNWRETDPTGLNLDKVSWYGITKIEGENIVRNLKTHIILRIAYPYRGRFDGKDDLAKRVLRLYHLKKLYPMFVDQKITPTFIDDIAPAISHLLKIGFGGTIHLASPITTTQYDFAKELITTFGANPNTIQRGSIVEFLNRVGVTPRSANSNLNVEKIISLGFNPTDWKQGIKTIYTQSNGHLI